MNFLRSCFALWMILLSITAFAGSSAKAPEPASPISAPAANEVKERWMVEGATRYRTNCGRCHQPPHKFLPREMATAVRHMRVRAMLTEDDMRYVIYYLTH